MDEEARYICPSCGEEIVIPVDITQGEQQEYVEDCPVCCCPVVLRIEFDPDGGVSCSASAE
ncbi:CPXCG motif-containing cysteine-rich protein [Planctomicrobium sp. SH661]|uniref:CPXCG motif-containing cysteine-rich protein n=1 Tax=Planctomicrobium sp. SH661 TaxID=3448124 RepID=UPI003F5AE34F